MLENVLYAILAILGLGVLVFIHELGHYWIARRQGMRIEAFAIGFGKPILSWEFQGVKWHICCLPFGGYVKIAGMQKEGTKEPHDIPDGFYGKRPWQRIQVALAGPLVNIVFAFACFVTLWLLGGRQKPFSDFTHRIGWVDPKSELYQKGVRPGDVIQNYDGKPFHGFKDLLMAGILNEKAIRITGYKVDYSTGEHIPFDYTLPTYELPNAHARDKMHTIGVLSPASFLMYDETRPLSQGSPMYGSGLLPQDRLLWIDGEVAFSVPQMTSLINESTSFLTVQRGNQIFHTKVARVPMEDLKLSLPEKGEFDDWQHEAHISGKLQDLHFIPYMLSPDCKVEGSLAFIDEEDRAKALEKCQRCSYFTPLEEDDQILAIDGVAVTSSYELLSRLQTRRVLVIVERSPQPLASLSWNRSDLQFDDFSPKNLDAIISSIGTSHPVQHAGHLFLLKPVIPRSFLDYPFTAEQKKQIDEHAASYRKYLDSIQDPDQRLEAARQWEKQQKRAILGIPLIDRKVTYNPSPLEQFGGVFEDTWRALFGLFSGYLNPKYLSGPVGIVHIVHNSWMVGTREALYWLAVISLNLGLLNLLPIPVLDGGHILFSVWEAITRRPIRSKTMERLIIPFVGLLIAFFIYVTYQDIARLFSHFF
ncbi:MAG: site-2 protease family protein [Chlamydiia bacterium]|nr:site-2 protease family protein [Chlamydiia bacterium]